MSVKSIWVSVCIVAVGAGLFPATGARAQTTEPAAPSAGAPLKTFRLLRDSATVAQDLDVGDETEKWVPGLRPGKVELSMSLGFMNLGTTLLQHEQMIYKYTTEGTYWGDVKISGQTAFNPLLRVGYTIRPWLGLEGYGGISISKYTSTVENRRWRKNEPNAVPQDNPPLGEYDAESRSLITLQAGVDAMIYPLNFSGDALGRWQPYLTAQAGGIWYDMNSDFTAGAAGSSDFALGGGLRLLAERNVSLRLEATYHVNTIDFKPAEFFLETDEGTTRVPLVEYPRLEGGAFAENPITSFVSEDLNYLSWSIGFQGSF